MNKQQAITRYELARKLRYHSPLADWLKVFPDRASLERFRLDVGQLAWPATFGDSPWDDAFSVAYELHHGLSRFSAGYYAANLDSPYVKPKLALLEAYGLELPPELRPVQSVYA